MGIEWCGSKEGRRRGGIDLRRRGVHGTEATPISNSTRVKNAIATWRKELVGATARTFAGPDRFPAERCDGDDESGALLS